MSSMMSKLLNGTLTRETLDNTKIAIIISEIIFFCRSNYNNLIRYDSFCSAKVSFKKTLFNQSIRKKNFIVLDFLSFVGGFLGLFAGFSVLSFVEMVYWIFGQMCKLLIRQKIPQTSIIKVKSIITEKSEFRLVKQAGLENLIPTFFNESSVHGFNFIFNSTILES